MYYPQYIYIHIYIYKYVHIYIYIYTRTKDKFDEPIFKEACIWEEMGVEILQFCNLLISVNMNNLTSVSDMQALQWN